MDPKVGGSRPPSCTIRSPDLQAMNYLPVRAARIDVIVSCNGSIVAIPPSFRGELRPRPVMRCHQDRGAPLYASQLRAEAGIRLVDDEPAVNVVLRELSTAATIRRRSAPAEIFLHHSGFRDLARHKDLVAGAVSAITPSKHNAEAAGRSDTLRPFRSPITRRAAGCH